jgi:hypothetical protein
MTVGDLAHLVFVFAGLVVGLGVGLHHGPLGALIGALAGAVVAHLMALLVWVGEMLVWGIRQIWTERISAKRNRPRK